MAFENVSTGYTASISQSGSYPQAKAIRPEPEAPRALRELAEAYGEYARASEAYIAARHDLNDARGRLDAAHAIADKTRETEGV